MSRPKQLVENLFALDISTYTQGMTMDSAEIEEALLALDTRQRAAVIRHALQTLDPKDTSSSQAEIDTAWREEFVRRLGALNTGQVTPIPLDEGFAQARAAIAAIHT